MERYQHRQPAHGMWLAMGLTALFIVVVTGLLSYYAPIEDQAAVGWLTVLILLVIGFFGWLFGALTVVIDAVKIDLRFGPGWPRRSIALSHVRTAYPVRNSWWYGWGIRLTPHGWLWNVSGLDAVELELSDGRLTRIGTDEPEELAAAIKAALGS